jgi:hypothetical protein
VAALVIAAIDQDATNAGLAAADIISGASSCLMIVPIDARVKPVPFE